jgi:adenylate cyclase
VLAGAIDTNDGEILKFVGDGLLAIFPSVDGGSSAETVCANALSAARAALRAADRRGAPVEIRFGIGLNFGDVLYGNIGSASRLDFTVMGQAVNIAARIEELCDATHRPLLFSQQVADRLRQPATFVTEARLKGQQGLAKVFTSAEYA